METKKTKRLFNFLLLLLVLPLFIHLVGLPKLKSLKGAVTESPKPKFAVTKWFEGDYQKEAEVYLNEKFGLRNFFIRLNNQVAYSFYGLAKANGVVIGKDGYLFEKSYIDAYYGRDFLGKDSIDALLNKVKYIQDTLHKRGIDLVVVINPGKGSYLPEKIPDNLRSAKGITNHEYFSIKAQDLQINLLDFNTYFLRNKDKFRYPLFPKCGIHWSTYCEILAKDSLLSYIGYLTKIQTPDIIIDTVLWGRGNKFREDDIKDGMNILWGPEVGKVGYPKYHIVEKGRTRPNVLVVADSFYWGIYGYEDISKLFAKNQFWFYFHELYNAEWGNVKYPDQISLDEEISKHQVVIIMATESTLPRFGWGFVQKAYTQFQPRKTQ